MRTYLNWRIGQRGALCGMWAEATLWHIEGLRGVVEGPLEVLGRRKGIYFANDFGRLAAGHAIDFLLIGPANWFICRGRWIDKRREEVSQS